MEKKNRNLGRSTPDIYTEMRMRRQMQSLVREMYKDIIKEITPEYKKHIAKSQLSNGVANDSMESYFIILIMKKMRAKWYPRFTSLSKELAQWLSKKTYKRADSLIVTKLEEYGFTVKRNTEEGYQKAVLKEVVKDSVGKWQSLPMYAAAQAQDAIMTAYSKGRDMEYLTSRLRDVAEISTDKAALIARDQINRATQQMAIASAESYGLQKGRWIHVPGEHSSRITHLNFDGEIFDLEQGLYDEDVEDYVKPGELIYCNCQFVPVIPGFEE